MSERTPTPGPWMAHFGWATEGLTAPSNEHPDYCEITGGSFENKNHMSVSGHIGMTNARLIASAPDLLSVATELDHLSLVIESAVRNADRGNHTAILALLQANRASLVKAKAS